MAAKNKRQTYIPLHFAEIFDNRLENYQSGLKFSETTYNVLSIGISEAYCTIQDGG